MGIGCVIFAMVVMFLLIEFAALDKVITSKACYGTEGNECTQHTLKCTNGSIQIKKAFFTISLDCPLVGVADCEQINVCNFSDTEDHENFTSAMLTSLNNECNQTLTCFYKAQRIEDRASISVIEYVCINGFGKSACPETVVTTTYKADIEVTYPTTTKEENKSHDQHNVGAIAGGVTAALIICMLIVAFVVWFMFIRNKNRDQKPEPGKDNYDLVGPVFPNSDVRNQRTSSSYDYATIHDEVKPTGQVRPNDYDLAGKPKSQSGGAAEVEDDYNHINHNPPQGCRSSGYDTAASAAAAMKKLNKGSSHRADDYEYNHLGDQTPRVQVSSDYDTTVSASKAVAQLGGNGNSEDDYDHFKRSEVKAIDSPYDTANHNHEVSADGANNPYELAK